MQKYPAFLTIWYCHCSPSHDLRIESLCKSCITTYNILTYVQFILFLCQDFNWVSRWWRTSPCWPRGPMPSTPGPWRPPPPPSLPASGSTSSTSASAAIISGSSASSRTRRIFPLAQLLVSKTQRKASWTLPLLARRIQTKSADPGTGPGYSAQSCRSRNCLTDSIWRRLKQFEVAL